MLGLLLVAAVLAPITGWVTLGPRPPDCTDADGPPIGPEPTASASAPPGAKGPVGWDSLRDLGHLPLLTIGTRPRLFSSTDPAGGNSDGFRTGYLCRAPGGYVVAEHSGPGELTSLWFTRDGAGVRANGRLVVELDGERVVDAPLQDVVDGRLGAPFVHPLVGNAAQASGGAYIQVPMPFRRSMRVLTTRPPRFHRVQLRAFADAAGVARFDPSDPATDVLADLRDPRRLEVAPPTGTRSRHVARDLRLDAGEASAPVVLDGAGLVTRVRLRLPDVDRRARGGDGPDALLQGLRLQVVADGTPTVDAPLSEFFGVGLGPRDLDAMTFSVHGGTGFEARWPMPFARRLEVRLLDASSRPVTGGSLEVTWHRDDRWRDRLGPGGRAGHFQAVSRVGRTHRSQDWVLADVTGQVRLVGLSQTVLGRQRGRTYLEGDDRVRIDGAGDPQLEGTGTEDLYLAAWYFERGPFGTPFSGLSGTGQGQPGCPHACDAMYRVMVADAVDAHDGLAASIEHGARDDFDATYRTTAFLYRRPAPAMHRTDRVEVSGGPLHELTSRYPGRWDRPALTDLVRRSRDPVVLHVRVDPDNGGVLLRRRSDAARRGQAARVWVDGAPAGVWLQPEGNPVQRWHDDDLVLPARLTAGRSELAIRLEPLAGHPPWTAAEYEVFSLRRPRSPVSAQASVVVGER